jgi:hypothetical protein
VRNSKDEEIIKVMSLFKRMDRYIEKRMKKIGTLSDNYIEYLLNGGVAQYIGASVAYNTGIATEYISVD